ncbi:GreA/GreB family elongation factor [Desulfuromonas carbonis]|uniref:GreA/GreB family elongation factor n=1 Tax=Desulfuromonas sp. DDH964 TaxID=1823759 RepID=UPI00078ED8D2|nr:GreA/GreB family elongation factor [Desulfuromonas sp. DDH964]AMV72319.1 GreA/GreB family elongation factor [Desulfuromonas sp. DDH964]
MTKACLLEMIVTSLSVDLTTLTEAARAAHAAATHEECQPDNKYDTTGLEASYIAQGQANRAAEVRRALERYRALELRSFDAGSPVRLTALVTLEAEDGSRRQVFLGPDAGGLKLAGPTGEIIIVTIESPLGRALLGRVVGEEIETGNGGSRKNFTIVTVA